MAGKTSTGPETEAVVAPQIGLARGVAAEMRFHPVRHDNDRGRIGAEVLDDDRLDVLARRRDDRRSADRPRDRRAQVSTLDRRQVLRIRQVLQVVDRQHDRPAADGRHGAAAVVHDVGGSRLPGQPRVLRQHATRSVGAGDPCRDDRVQRHEFGMGVDEGRQAVQRGRETLRSIRQAEELAHQVLLGTADVSRHAPRQVHRDAGHLASSR